MRGPCLVAGAAGLSAVHNKGQQGDADCCLGIGERAFLAACLFFMNLTILLVVCTAGPTEAAEEEIPRGLL